MSDAQAPVPVPSPSLINATLLVYGLFGLAALIAIVAHGFPPFAPLGGLAGIIAIIVAYVKRSEASGTWLASHYRWLIRTFWFSLLWGLVGLVLLLALALVLIGFVVGPIVWIATSIWVLYRLIRGYLLFNDSKPVSAIEIP
jgi:uncharacterized membrane protein